MDSKQPPMPVWKPFAAAAATGCLIALAAPGVLPVPGAGALAWVAFVPLLLVVRDVSPARAALLGWLSAFVLHLVAASWFPGLMARFNGLHPALAVLAFVAISAAQSVSWAVWSGSLNLLSKRWPFVLAAPVSFLAMEFAAPMVFRFGVGLTQYKNLLAAQAAELGGLPLVGAMLVAAGAAIASAIRDRKASVPSFAAVAVAILLLLGFGWLRLSHARTERNAARTMRVGWIQAGVVHTGWSPPAPDPGVLARYQRASAALEEKHGRVELLIWPEKAYELLLANAKHDYPADHRRRIRKDFESTLLFGHTSVHRKTREIGNAAALLEPDGRLRVVYEKVELIPFSEWIPSWLEGKVGGGKRYRPGDSLAPVIVPTSHGNASVGVFICFESTFPGLVRAIVAHGADLLVNLSDDTWFGDSAEPEQHLAHVVFRAVENRRDIVRATGGGVSAVVASTGDLLHRTELNRAAEAVGRVAEVRLLRTRSIHARIGDSVPAACAITWLLWMLGATLRRR